MQYWHKFPHSRNGGDEFLVKNTKSVFVFTGIMVLSILLIIPASASVLPPSPDEIQNLRIVTSVDGVGGMSQDSKLSWSLSSEVLNANLFAVTNPDDEWDFIWVLGEEPPLNKDGEVQSHVTYSEKTNANMGVISYRKTSEVDTEPLLGAQYNVWNERQITFTGIDSGSLLSSEDLTMYNVGTCFPAALSVCPFTCCDDCGFIPASCSMIETGSNLDVSRVAAYIAGGVRNVNRVGDSDVFPPIPSVDGPALAKYRVQVTEMNPGKPSLGTVSTYLKITEKDSDFDCRNPQAIAPGKDLMQNLEISEFRNMKGSINLFDYQMNYQSRISPSAGCNV